jgi:hypothetical protein
MITVEWSCSVPIPLGADWQVAPRVASGSCQRSAFSDQPNRHAERWMPIAGSRASEYLSDQTLSGQRQTGRKSSSGASCGLMAASANPCPAIVL